MESGRKARVEALAKMMSGDKPPKKSKARVIPRRLGKGAKLALRDFAAWAREQGSLNDEQAQCLSELIKEWSEVKLAMPGEAVMPMRDRLTSLHRRLAKSGAPGDFAKWKRYIDAVRELEKVTDSTGRPAASGAAEEEQHALDEKYVSDQQFLSLDEVNEMLATVRWNKKREEEQRAEAERVERFATNQLRAVEETARQQRQERREQVKAVLDLDEDGFTIEASDTTPEVVEAKAAVFEGYSWRDDEKTVSVYVELSRPVKTNELDINITANTLQILHNASLVLKRSFYMPIKAGHEDTLWFLEDSGFLLRFELVKQEHKRVDDQPNLWPGIFHGDQRNANRATRSDDQRLDWTQSEYDLTLKARIPRGTTKADVSVSLRKDSLRVYVRRTGLLVDGVLNRSVNVKESSWHILDTELSITLVKLRKQQPWQRLIAGGKEIPIRNAYEQMASEPPERGDLSYDDLDREEQMYCEALRQLEEAQAQGDKTTAEDIMEELNSYPLILHHDIDRKHRARVEETSDA